MLVKPRGKGSARGRGMAELGKGNESLGWGSGSRFGALSVEDTPLVSVPEVDKVGVVPVDRMEVVAFTVHGHGNSSVQRPLIDISNNNRTQARGNLGRFPDFGMASSSSGVSLVSLGPGKQWQAVHSQVSLLRPSKHKESLSIPQSGGQGAVFVPALRGSSRQSGVSSEDGIIQVDVHQQPAKDLSGVGSPMRLSILDDALVEIGGQQGFFLTNARAGGNEGIEEQHSSMIF